ncbi:MAG: hypothetical protein LBT61_03610 [Prevotellaceae bacterium]|jgi:REP element-mobilizing transposase RayT|nr:hypothetical protein [Prevotellaceae bacterium]
MSDEKFQNKYRIPSARAVWHDYGGGAYFITVCTKNRVHYLGEIVHINTPQNDTIMQLSPIGQFLTDKIINITLHQPYAEIPLFVVMPNHFHLIVLIDGNKIPYQRRNVKTRHACPVETRHATSLHGASIQAALTRQTMQKIANLQGWLSVAIGGIKSAVTKFADANGIEFAWQPRFDDRIIRNQYEMNRIAEYIENNPASWETDCFNEQ